MNSERELRRQSIDDVIAEYEHLLKIDNSDLHVTCIKHPEYAYKAHKEAVEAQDRRDSAKDELALAEADAKLRARANLEDSGNKVTEALIDQTAKHDGHYVKALEKYRDAEYALNRYNALSAAFRDRGYILTRLCELYVAGYFSEISVSTDRGDAAEVIQRSVRRAQSEKRKKTTSLPRRRTRAGS